MKIFSLWRLTGTVALWCVTASAWAQAPAPVGDLTRLLAARPTLNKSVSIEEAVTIALKESPAVRGAMAEIDAAEGRVGIARAQTRLSVSANIFVSGGSNANIVASPLPVQPQQIQALPRDAFFDQNISLMYPLSTGGRLTARVRQAAALRDAARADGEMQRQEVALLTRMAYRDILARRALIAVQRARLAENEERLRLDRVRLEQERIPAYYVQRDEAEVAATKQGVTDAERDADIAVEQLKTVMGVNPASQLTLTATEENNPTVAEVVARVTPHLTQGEASVTPAPAGTDADFSALLRVAEVNRPELQSAAQRALGASEGASAVRGAYRPQVSLFGMGDILKARNQSAFTGVTYGLVASIPLYTGGQQRAEIQTATAERRREEREQERIALQVVQEVRVALLNLRAAAQNIETATAGLRAAQEGFRVAELRYQSGRSIVTEVLETQTARIQAQTALIQAHLHYQLAGDQLLHAVGRING